MQIFSVYHCIPLQLNHFRHYLTFHARQHTAEMLDVIPSTFKPASRWTVFICRYYVFMSINLYRNSTSTDLGTSLR